MSRYGKPVMLLLAGNQLAALVIREQSHSPLGNDGRPLVVDGKALPAQVYLDLAYVNPGLEDMIKTTALDGVLRPAYDVPPYVDGARIGWQDVDVLSTEEMLAIQTTAADNMAAAENRTHAQQERGDALQKRVDELEAILRQKTAPPPPTAPAAAPTPVPAPPSPAPPAAPASPK